MKTCKTCQAEKPLIEFYVRKETGRYRTECKACWNVRTAKWAAENNDKRRAISLKWGKANYPYLRMKKAEYRAKDPLRMRRWAIENPERMQACRDRWEAANKDRKAEHAAWRRGRVKQAIPTWANRFFIAEAFHLARMRTKLTGIKWEVDHIIPLAGKKVCGLHVESNFRVIPARINRIKGHHRWPDMP